MRAVVMHEPGNVTVEDMPMPSILEPTDAIIKLAATCICGSDLWPYRGAHGPRVRRNSRRGGRGRYDRQARRFCRRLLLHFLRRVRNLPLRLPLALHDR